MCVIQKHKTHTMNGNNSMTKAGFISSLAHPRKQQLATILFGEGDVFAQAIEAGFNDILIKEMARDIRRSVEGCENFSVDFAKTDEVASVDETANTINHENTNTDSGVDSANSGNVPTDSNPTVENNVPTDPVDQIPGAPVQTDGNEQSEQNTGNPQS